MRKMLRADDIQDLLQVDRSTVYRMADAGSIPAVKVGKQWRFPSDLIEGWLKGQLSETSAAPLPTTAPHAGLDLVQLIPRECVQLMLDTFADALQISLILTDLNGQPVTDISGRTGLYAPLTKTPAGQTLFTHFWGQLAHQIDLEPHWKFGPDGLFAARAFVRVDNNLSGMVIATNLAPANWPPCPELVAQLAEQMSLPEAELQAALVNVYQHPEAIYDHLLSLLQRVANVVAHILQERQAALSKLNAIAKLSML